MIAAFKELHHWLNANDIEQTVDEIVIVAKNGKAAARIGFVVSQTMDSICFYKNDEPLRPVEGGSICGIPFRITVAK